MVVGRWMVNNQTPEYVGAPQKRWAWALGFILVVLLSFLFLINRKENL
jgi:hypothetical protein